MHYPNIAELKDLVIIDSQVIYDSVTILILRSMTFKNIDHAAAQHFKKTGKFSVKYLTAVTVNVSGVLIPVSKLVMMLKYLNTIAEVFVPELFSSVSPNDGNITYIMPCVLERASQAELDLFHQESTRNLPASPNDKIHLWLCPYRNLFCTICFSHSKKNHLDLLEMESRRIFFISALDLHAA